MTDQAAIARAKADAQSMQEAAAFHKRASNYHRRKLRETKYNLAELARRCEVAGIDLQLTNPSGGTSATDRTH